MTELPYERQAMANEPLPEGLSMAHQLMYLSLRTLYQLHYAGKISREQAQHDKGELLNELDKVERMEQFNNKLAKHTADMYRDIELAVTTYRKNRTVDNADRVINAIYPSIKDKIWEDVDDDKPTTV